MENSELKMENGELLLNVLGSWSNWNDRFK